MSDLARFRADIDDIDDRIVDLLARRFAISREVADHKLRHGIPIVLPERIEELFEEITAAGIEVVDDQKEEKPAAAPVAEKIAAAPKAAEPKKEAPKAASSSAKSGAR